MNSHKIQTVNTKIPKVILLFLFLIAVSFLSVRAQAHMDSPFVLSDTTQTLSLDEFYKIILDNHPIVKQAGLFSKEAQEELRFAKGLFDPKLGASFDRKEFEDKTYYSKLDAYLRLPTWFPVNPKIGYQQNTGELVNSEEAIPGGKQWYAGVSVPIAKGLFTDERRTTVKQAMLLKDIATADQIKIINKTLLDAAKDYWAWYYAYYNLQLTRQGVAIAKEIFSRVKINSVQGEAATIDTVQAKITLQSRLVEQQESLLELQNAAIIVSNYLWEENAEPLQLGADVAPVMTDNEQLPVTNELLEELSIMAKENHPELIKLIRKSDQLLLERKLARENFKPQLDLSYSLLSQPSAPHELDPLNDYKIGLDFSFPVFLRKERAKLKLNQLKIDNTTFQTQATARKILNEIATAFNDAKNTIIIISQQQQMVKLYQQLLQSELINLENGESDLFKINIQQEKLLQSQTKLLKLRTELQKKRALLYWAAGVRNLQFD